MIKNQVLLVLITIHRLECAAGDKFELVFEYGILDKMGMCNKRYEADKLPQYLSGIAASFSRRCLSPEFEDVYNDSMVVYDGNRKKMIMASEMNNQNLNQIFARANCNSGKQFERVSEMVKAAYGRVDYLFRVRWNYPI